MSRKYQSGIYMPPRPTAQIIFGWFVLSLTPAEERPGMASLTIYTTDEEMRGSDAEFDAMGVIPLNNGSDFNDRPCRFNAHDSRQTDGRVPGECCATLVAKHFKWDDSSVQKLLSWLYVHDTSSASASSLTQLVKVVNATWPVNTPVDHIVNWACKAFDAIIWAEQAGHVPTSYRETVRFLDDVAGEIVSAGNVEVRNRLHQLFKQSAEKLADKPDHILEIVHIVDCLRARQGATGRLYTDREVAAWAGQAIRAINAQQAEFLVERQRIEELMRRTPPIVVCAQIGDRQETLNFMVVEKSTSQCSAKAARSLGADIVLVTTPQGNVTITYEHRLQINLDKVVQMIRWAEMDVEDRVNSRFCELDCHGASEAADNWFYNKTMKMVFNGSANHAAVPTRLSLGQLISIVKAGFHPELFAEWCEANRVPTGDTDEQIAEGTKALFENSLVNNSTN